MEKCKDKILMLVLLSVAHSTVEEGYETQTVCANDKFDMQLCEKGDLIKIRRAEYGLSECNGTTCCFDRALCMVDMPENHHWEDIHYRCHDHRKTCDDLTAQIQHIGYACTHGKFSDFVRIHYECKKDNDTHIGWIALGLLAGLIFIAISWSCFKLCVKRNIQSKGLRIRDVFCPCCVKKLDSTGPVEVYVNPENSDYEGTPKGTGTHQSGMQSGNSRDHGQSSQQRGHMADEHDAVDGAQPSASPHAKDTQRHSTNF